jgi:NADPH:quinone reductase-like Zn-dependent oxidoreductase
MCSARHAIAEYVVTDASRATKIPAGMSFEEATTLPVALQTMHDALMTNGRLKKGESVLVQGASSGVGLMALKIAKLMGAGLVIGTSTNEARRTRLKEFGADLRSIRVRRAGSMRRRKPPAARASISSSTRFLATSRTPTCRRPVYSAVSSMSAGSAA